MFVLHVIEIFKHFLYYSVMEKKPQTNGSPLFTFFQFKFGEIVSLIRVIRTIFMIGIIVAVFAFTFTFILYCLYKYFIPGLFILAGGMIFLPLLVYLFRRLKKVLLAISIGITCGVMVFITIWEIRDHITSKHLNAGFFEPNGLIPVYSIILVLILWIITNIASIFFNRLDKPERYSISGKFLLGHS